MPGNFERVLPLHVLADSLLTLGCFSIPLMLLHLSRQRRDLEFNSVLVGLMVFLVACGATHLMAIWTLWQPLYWLSGLIKATAAAAAVATAILTLRSFSAGLGWPSAEVLQNVKASLELEIAARKRVEMEIHRIEEQLETRVAERTRQLELAFQSLQQTQQASMQRERSRALGRMAGGIAHDINNALTPAILYTQSLLHHEKNLSSEVRNDLAIIQQAIKEVIYTLGRIKEFYPGRAASAVRAPIEMPMLLEQVVDLTRLRWADAPSQGGSAIDLRTECPGQLPLVLGAQLEIRDALMNLVFNAVDAMPDGGTLTLRCHAQRDRVSVEVCDTGVGMTAEVRARCLEPFFTTKGGRGRGLGLAIVYGVADRHGGELEIDSEPGKGTVARLVFPAAPESISAPAQANTSSLWRKQLRILVIDDDELPRQSMRAILEREGHSVCVAHGGLAGIEVFAAAFQRGERFDVVITDLGMPHVDGRAVAAAVKVVSPDTPVVLLTGWGQHLRDSNEIPPQVDRMLDKPAELAEVRSALADLVREVA